MPQIVSAFYYGKDVTTTVQNLVSEGTITVSNDTLGGDPAPGMSKVLTVGYDDGSTRAAGEQQKIKLSTAQIVSAFYYGKDVTTTVQNLVSEGTITVSNDILGGDPGPGISKILTVDYDDGTSRAAGEGQKIRLN